MSDRRIAAGMKGPDMMHDKEMVALTERSENGQDCNCMVLADVRPSLRLVLSEVSSC